MTASGPSRPAHRVGRLLLLSDKLTGGEMATTSRFDPEPTFDLARLRFFNRSSFLLCSYSERGTGLF